MNFDGYRHPVIERGDLSADEMIEHNRKVSFDVQHAGMSFYGGKRHGWENIFGEKIDEAPDPNDTEAWLARRAADRERIPPYYESPRPIR